MTNFLYNPDRKSKEQLIAEFVVRTNVLDEIMQDIETSDMKTPEQHYLLVGQRGSGKTTLLNRIKYAVEDSEKLKDWLIPVIFSEEQYNITELANLWENVGQVLEDYHGFEGVVEEMEKQVSRDDFEEKAYEVLEKQLKKRKKKLVLLVDNIGDFLKKLDENEVRRLRELLQTKSSIRIVAGSSFYLESVLDYKQPLFEFFKVIRLDGLTQVETQELLKKLAVLYKEEEKIDNLIKKRPERIETLRVLTGGVPRTIALMFRIFVDYEHDSSIRDLEHILDAVTPLYKHRMDDLPTQQQKIVDAVAKNWDAISVNILRGKVRLESKLISSQLRQLEKNQIIERRDEGKKNHVYLLQERFFNIWYLMRYGRKSDKQRVIWLVRFLENWCSKSDIEKRVYAYINDIKKNRISSDNILFFGLVYSSFENLSLKIRSQLTLSAPTQVVSEIKFTKSEIIELVKKAINKRKFDDAIKWFSFSEKLSIKDKLVLLSCIDHLSKSPKTQDVDVADLVSAENGNTNLFVRVQIVCLAALVEFSLLCSALIKVSNNSLYSFDNVIGLMEKFFLLFCEIYRIFGIKNDNKLSVELEIIVIALRNAHKVGLIKSILRIFEGDVAEQDDIIKRRMALRTILEPLYKALLIITNKLDYSKIPPEKEQLIRNIVERITQKD